MGALMLGSVRGVGEGLDAAIMLAQVGPFTGMGPQVNLEVLQP